MDENVLLAGVSGPRLHPVSTVDAFFALSVRLPPPPQLDLDSCAIPQAAAPTRVFGLGF